MKKLIVLVITSIMVIMGCSRETAITIVDLPDTTESNRFYTGNREPLLTTPFIKLPIGSVKPGGWILKQLELQADGYFGHLGEISPFLVKENNAWLDFSGEGDHGWEEPVYWLKGFSNMAYLLGREDMLKETKIWIEAALSSQKPDGWFGPDQDRTGAATQLTGRDDLWPNMIMLFCFQDYHEYSGDERVIELMTNYFRYLNTIPDEKFLMGYWPKNRGGDLLYSVYWLYNRTGDKWLLDLADKVHRNSVNWTDSIPNWHNVNMSQSFGEPTTYYMQSRDTRHLEASERNYREIRKLFGQVPGGMFGADENCREGYTDPRQAIETCGMVEMMLSTEILLRITGNPVWADRCEDVAFNSYPAALTADMKALRYLTSPNLVRSDAEPKSPGVQNGGPMLHMNPYLHRCCQHNQGHGWPYYAQNLWLATSDNGLAAVLFSECEVTAQAGDGTIVTIKENTRYPFEEEIEFIVSPDNPVTFPLYLRIPGWCKNPQVSMNGQVKSFPGEKANYIRIERNWDSEVTVKLILPMEISIRTWRENKNSVSIDRGPLTYSLKIGEEYIREGGSDEWPAWEIYPNTPWNYGLILDDSNPAGSFEVVMKDWAADNMPFTHNNIPIEVKAKGKRIPRWKTDSLGLVGLLQPSPVRSDQPVENITLIPMGAARLRISAFPVIGEGAGTH
ncbi:MAG: glycoside hydrolase family 127 protein, partial [Bacteroidales bacterium]